MLYDLVLLLPPDEPPLIGVSMSRHDAETLNNDLILEHANRNYKIVLEPHKDKLNVRLICEEIVSVRFYDQCKCSAEKLKSWLYVLQYKKHCVVNFAQLFFDNGKLEVAMTAKLSKRFVLKISKIEVITSKE
jgi:hypothetical protein